MKSQAIQTLSNQLDALIQSVPEDIMEFWYACKLQASLGFARCENFMTAIKEAMEPCGVKLPSQDIINGYQ